MSEPSPSVRPRAPLPGPRALATAAPRLLLVALIALAPALLMPTGPAIAQVTGSKSASASSQSASTGQTSSTRATASSASASSSSARPSAPQPAEPEATGGVSLDLVDGGDVALKPGGKLTLTVRLTNRGTTAIEDPALELRVRTDRVTDRRTLAQWQQQDGPDTYGVPATTEEGPASLDAGDSAEFTLSVDADDLGLSTASYLWGARRLSVTATDADGPLASLRSFTVWRPDDADAKIAGSVLLPLSASDPGAAVSDPDAYEASAESGRLKDLEGLAARDDVDWMLDPALLDPPALSDADAGDSSGSGSSGSDSSADAEDGDDAGDDGDSAQTPPARFTTPDATKHLADTLTSGAKDRDVIGLPYAQSDTIGLEQAGTTDLSDALAARSEKVWEDAHIDPLGEAVSIPGEEASGKTLSQAVTSGADLLVVPSSSLRADPVGTVTPSSVGTFTAGDRTVPVLAPDPTLSDEVSELRTGEDVQQVRQRILAETAVIASEQSSTQRQVLIAPQLGEDMDAGAVSSTLDALDDAPWMTQAPVSDLLDAAEGGDMVTDTGTEGDGLYALGELDADDVRPSGPGEDGTWAHLPRARSRDEVDTGTLQSLQRSLRSMSTVAAVAEDDAPFSATRTLILTTTSTTLAKDHDEASRRAKTAQKDVAAMREAIHVVPASGYNLVSDSAGVPITVTNDLDSPITVKVEVSTDRPIVRVGEPTTVEVPARQKKEVTVPIDAIANGTVTLTSTVRSEDGEELAAPVSVPLSVNPAWENWTTMVLVGAMGVLVVVGVLRARRTGSRRRAAAAELTDDGEGEAAGDAADEEKP
ncbi:DUF6049 family protein [Brachybacterium kimchii]|uniref:DUF6049 family protein n=1 Tax=Brachybacterium kimchii TaxID=2942909 RepID=A0ABY4N6C4_9MICO|nr:DUF6049 family protein [Brachybacterium kimchii]UQN28705.1 DUF6049 family protein [Brachybacterium kimchii]